MAMTALGNLLAILAGLLRDLTQLAASPSGLIGPTLTALAATVLAGAMLAAVLALLTSVARHFPHRGRPPAGPPRPRAAGEVLAGGVLAPARS